MSKTRARREIAVRRRSRKTQHASYRKQSNNQSNNQTIKHTNKNRRRTDADGVLVNLADVENLLARRANGAGDTLKVLQATAIAR
jgi:hypothetical protein